MTCKCISDIGVVALAHARYNNSTLRYLDLSYNCIGDAGTVALAQALHGYTYLEQLSLSIGDTGTVALHVAQDLHGNHFLTQLDLSYNCIGDAGAKALALALHQSSYTLTRLDLSANDGIEKEGTHQLVQALTVNEFICEWDCLSLPSECEEYATL